MIKLHDAGKLRKTQQLCFTTPRAEWEFYDLQEDPFEMRNAVDDPRFAAKITELKSALEKWQTETTDLLPAERREDGFDRTTGEKLKAKPNSR
jgi:hypothetical protein